MNIDSAFIIGALGAIAAYFLLEVFRLGIGLRAIRTSVARVRQALDAGDRSPEKALTDEELLREPWLRYRRTFLSEAGAAERQKTDFDAERFFNESTVIPQRLNVRYWVAVPSLLVGIGILGTFIGLTLGISDFNTETVEGVRTSITTLLDGMAAAFVTSIAGMFLSIVFNVFEKRGFKRVADELRRLAARLDDRFRLTTADRLRYQREDQARLLRALFTYQTPEGEVVTAGHVLRDLRADSREQTAALKSFSTDLADGIAISTSTIEALGVHLGEVFKAAMGAKLTPALESVQQAVKELRDEKAASSAELVGDIVGELQGTLQDMGQQFQSALSGGAIAQLEEVANSVGATGAVLQGLPETLEQLVSELRQSVVDTTVRIGEETELAAGSMREGMQQAASEFGAIIGQLQEQSGALLSQQESNTASVNEAVEGLAAVIAAGRQLTEAFTLTTSDLQTTLAQLGQLAAVLNRSTKNLAEGSEALKDTTTDFKNESAALQQAHRDTLSALQKALDEARQLGQDYAAQFETIGAGLRSVFSELQQGLSDYQGQTRESLNQYLGDFTQQLETASNALSGSVSALDDRYDELSDLVEQVGRSVSRGDGGAGRDAGFGRAS